MPSEAAKAESLGSREPQADTSEFASKFDSGKRLVRRVVHQLPVQGEADLNNTLFAKFGNAPAEENPFGD